MPDNSQLAALCLRLSRIGEKIQHVAGALQGRQSNIRAIGSQLDDAESQLYAAHRLGYGNLQLAKKASAQLSHAAKDCENAAAGLSHALSIIDSYVREHWSGGGAAEQAFEDDLVLDVSPETPQATMENFHAWLKENVNQQNGPVWKPKKPANPRPGGVYVKDSRWVYEYREGRKALHFLIGRKGYSSDVRWHVHGIATIGKTGKLRVKYIITDRREDKLDSNRQRSVGKRHQIRKPLTILEDPTVGQILKHNTTFMQYLLELWEQEKKYPWSGTRGLWQRLE